MSISFLDKAKSHWTKERELKVTGGKNWPLLPSEAPELLRCIGLLNADASMPRDSVRKFSQVNHMVSLIEPQLKDLAGRHRPVRVLDACCGTSYLTLILAWLLKHKYKTPCQIIGVDRQANVIETSQKRAATLDLQDILRFEATSIRADYGADCFQRLFPESAPQAKDKALRPHLVLALHACDMATDLALALGIEAKADTIAVAPCCHAELAQKWKSLESGKHPLMPIFKTPNLRRETAAHFTDALRMLQLRSKGYEVTATEFVPSTHTPKNRLLLASRRGNFLSEAQAQWSALKDYVGGPELELERLLAESKDARETSAHEP